MYLEFINKKWLCTTVSYIRNCLVGLMGHKAEQGEDDKTAKHAGSAVDKRDDYRVPEEERKTYLNY